MKRGSRWWQTFSSFALTVPRKSFWITKNGRLLNALLAARFYRFIVVHLMAPCFSLLFGKNSQNIVVSNKINTTNFASSLLFINFPFNLLPLHETQQTVALLKEK